MEKGDLLEFNNFIPQTRPPHLTFCKKRKKKKNGKCKGKADFSFAHNVFYFYRTCFSSLIHYQLLSVISLNLDQSKILLSGNGLMPTQFVID